jgi:branched-chain amino acid transport system ATP-binding protein
MIKTESISMKFGGLYALSDVSFEINKGELFSIIGPNGSGKSTLFNVITGVYMPTTGKVFLQDHEITGLSPHKINHLGLGRTFQNPRLFTDLTVLENVMIPLMVKNGGSLFWELVSSRRKKRITEKLTPIAMNALMVTGLAGKEHFAADKLSYGDQKRLEIARCYSISPDVIMLDEPVAGLNTEERDEINSLIKNINERGITIVLIEHDMKMVMGISDRIMVLNHGSPIAFGTPAEISNDPEVIKAYLGVEETDNEYA